MQCVLAELHADSVETFKDKLEIVVKPVAQRAVRATDTIEKGAMCLVPMTPSISVGATLPTGALELGPTRQGATALYALPKVQLPAVGKDAVNSNEFVAPFWFVGTTTDAKHANVQFQLRQQEYHGEPVAVPCIVNSKTLKPSDALKLLVKDNALKFPSYDLLLKKVTKA